MVGYDSIIPPGRAGSITEKVRLTNYRGGSYSKFATVTSNAKNAKDLQICMKWVIKEFVSISPSNLEISKNKSGALEVEMTLNSEKADLKLLGISFKAAQDKPPSDKTVTWQEELTIPLSFAFVKDSVVQGPDKMHAFKYKVTASYGETKNKNGEFILKTNHPEAPEIKVTGQINP